MSYQRLNNAAKKDGNHDEIRAVVRSMGAGWFDVFWLKRFCDAFIVHRGHTIAVEVKMPGKKQSEGEVGFQHEWEASGGRYEIIESIDQAVSLVKQLEAA
jgi:hypothetical protein